jgi:hypothetical protein
MFGLSFDDVALHRAGIRTEVGRLEDYLGRVEVVPGE